MPPIVKFASKFVDGTLPDNYTPDLEPDEIVKPEEKDSNPEEKFPPYQWVWRNVAIYIYLHFGAVLGIYCVLFNAMWSTVFFALLLHVIGCVGVTAGAHRLWAHRSYKAKLPFRILLGFWQTVAFQNHIYDWARDHRVHHKFTETNADPHNAKRGFFFSHMVWLLVKKHPDVKEKGQKLSYTDLLADPVVRFQKRYFLPLGLTCCFIMPTVVPALFWSENILISYLVCGILRYVCSLHSTWCVNSVAHLWGYKPFDININPVETEPVSFLAMGEGFHNYHHTFPMDYSASEYRYSFNLTTMFLDTMAFFGQVYDRKMIPTDAIRRRILKTGDKSYLHKYT